MQFERAIIIRDKTRLEQLIERFNSKEQARFYIERLGSDFDHFQDEHDQFYKSLKIVENKVSSLFKTKTLNRSFLPTYIFTAEDLIIVIGQDGLVANTAKYVNGQAIIAINPDPGQYDGVLLPFNSNNFITGVNDLAKDSAILKSVTMAEARLQDGQRLLAFNDFYIGASSHVSARYFISFQGKKEFQSSSGIIISTGAGSSGWLSSIFNMAYNMNQFTGQKTKHQQAKLDWDAQKLIFVVREPFMSQVTQVGIGFGTITNNQPLEIQSEMLNNGIIFSDGIEADFLSFNAGSKVTVGVAKEKAVLVWC